MLLSLTVNAQYILKEDPEHNAYRPLFGPNSKFYISSFIRLGFITGTADRTVYSKGLNSSNLAVGGQFKKKLTNTFSIGAELACNLDNYAISPIGSHADSLFLGKSQIHTSESFTLSSLQCNAFIRINFDPHRPIHSLGKYLDLGGGGEKVIMDAYNVSGSGQNTSFKNFSYVAKSQFNAFARLGMGSFAVCFNYRPSNLFIAKENLPEPPPYSMGLEIDPYMLLKGLGVFP